MPQHRTLPAFRGRVEGAEVAVIPWRRRPRWGDVWVFCVRAPFSPPMHVLNRDAFTSARLLGIGRARGFTPIRTGDAKLDRRFIVELTDGRDLSRALPGHLRRALLAYSGLYCFAVRRDGVALVFARERMQETARALDGGLGLLGEVVRMGDGRDQPG